MPISLLHTPAKLFLVLMAIDSPYYLGQYLYVASPTGILAFSINSTSGALTPLSGSPFAASGATLLTEVQIPPP